MIQDWQSLIEEARRFLEAVRNEDESLAVDLSEDFHEDYAPLLQVVQIPDTGTGVDPQILTQVSARFALALRYLRGGNLKNAIGEAESAVSELGAQTGK